MNTPESKSQPDRSAFKLGFRRARPWVAAGLALGLVTGAGVSLAATLPFSAGATTQSTEDENPNRTDEERDELQGHHGDRKTGNFDGPGRGNHRGMRGGEWRGDLIKSAAFFLGLTVEELRIELRSGLSLAEIAESNGETRQDLIDALIVAAIESMTEKISERIPLLVDREIGPRGDS